MACSYAYCISQAKQYTKKRPKGSSSSRRQHINHPINIYNNDKKFIGKKNDMQMCILYVTRKKIYFNISNIQSHHPKLDYQREHVFLLV